MKIDLRNLSRSFPSRQVLNNISLCIESGSFTTLLGPSGCGKTALLWIIAGLEIPDQGDIYFGNACIFFSPSGINLPLRKRGLDFAFQDFALWPHMAIFENVAFGLRAKGKVQGLDQQVKGAPEAVQFKGFEKRYPHRLSGGQQQRVAFARAVATRPPCILFDKPLSALGAILREEMRTGLRSLVSRLDTTLVFVTRDQIEVMAMSDRITAMSQEDVEQYERPEKIYECPSTPFIARFAGKSGWISPSTVIRSEHLSLTPTQRWEVCEIEMEGVQYMGGVYEVILRSREWSWSPAIHKGMGPGQRLTVFADSSHMLYLASEGHA